MESLSTPPHARRNPYDDVFLSTGPERETLEPHEYAEIFSGPSTIPVLDLSGLLGPEFSRDSKLDYSSIFGGLLRGELFNSSAEKAKQPDERVLLQESDSLHSAGNPKIPSGEASGQSADEPKKQFNVSFNRTHQRNIEASNGKAHVTQLQVVPGFTHFADRAPCLMKKDNGRTVDSLKRKVSRTWSFNAEAEAVKCRSGLSLKKSQMPDNKLQPSASYFVPKNDALEKNADEFTSPYNGEDIDDNSTAAASAAALKRAIDQAQESIRLAKMIMDRKKEGYQNGSKAGQRGRPKVSYREGEIDCDSKKNNFKEKSVELNLTQSLVYDNASISAAKIELESVCENAAEGKGRVLVLSRDVELFSSNGIQRESLCIDEQVELKKTEENVEVVGVHSRVAEFPVLLANELKTANMEQREVSVDHAQGSEVVAERVERDFDTSSRRIQELEINVEEGGDCKATFDHAEGSENKVERVLNSPQRTRKQWKVLGETCKYFRFSQVDGLFEERENDMDDKGKKEPGEVSNVECVMELDNIINETCNSGGNEALGQVETERESERKGNDYILKTYDDKANSCFESEEQLKEALEEESNPNVFPEIGEGDDEQNLPGEVEEKHMNTFECEVLDTIETDEKHCAQVQKGAALFVSDENRNSCQNEDDAYVEHINEAVDVNSSSSNSCQNEDDSLSSDGNNIENVHAMSADPEEKLLEDEGASSTGNIDDVAQEFDAEGVEQVSEDTSGSDEGSVSTSNHEIINGFSAYGSEECKENANDMTPMNDKLKDEVDLVSNESEGAGVRESNTENNRGNLTGTSLLKEKDEKVGDPQNNGKNDYQQRIDAIKRGREREKERKVVERAIREARERAFAEARERAERASVEKPSTEPRQRAMSEAREKVSHVKQQVVVDKARERAARAKLRAERAAVEKATTEARERALEKAVSLKTTHTVQRTPEMKHSFSSSDLDNGTESAQRHKARKSHEKAARAKLRAERAAVEKATKEARERALEKAMSLKTTHTSGSSRSNGLKHSFSSSDLDNGTESAQRHKARLEKHQRIMERVEKALVEKNVRDVLAQKEQAEKNRLAESLDVEIKRWATGKEKNLRALLSTLQFILGSDSGWQPIPLTDIVTAAAVKKAYRKATLCVHPDKLQQRGATIKQKYICEKVFDLLKVAWNRYDSEERR